MSRIRVAEVSSPISLFPFIGILLCTMGALMVVLVAVSKSAKATAERQILARHEAPVEADPEVKQELDKIQQYQTHLDSARAEANQFLSQDKLRLSHVEDHMRRLQDQLQKLVI